MSITQISIISFSPTGSTRKVLNEISLGFTLPVKRYDFTLSWERKELSFGPEDLVVVGFPVYGGRLPEPAEKIMRYFNSTTAKFAGVVVYGNRAFEDALIELKDLAEAGGFLFVGGGACIAQHSMLEEAAKGRPDADDMKELKAFGENLEAKCISGILETLEVPGEKPYRKPILNPPYGPVVSDACILCGACHRVCAFGAIPEDAPDTTLLDACKCCFACVRECPVNARAVTDERFGNSQKFIAANALGARKDPLFIL